MLEQSVWANSKKRQTRGVLDLSGSLQLQLGKGSICGLTYGKKRWDNEDIDKDRLNESKDEACFFQSFIAFINVYESAVYDNKSIEKQTNN